jgi:hypothetical protein
MKTRLEGTGALALMVGLFLVGCPPETKDTGGDTPSTSAKPSAKTSGDTSAAPAASSSAPPPAAGSAAPEPAPGGLSITPRAKAELDGKEPDAGYKGTTLAVTGAKYGFTAPTGWKTSSAADVSMAAADGDKAKFGATGYKDGDDMAQKTEAVLKGLGLTGCTWGADEDVTLGKDKVPAKVADGVCKRDKADVRVIRAIVTGENAKIVAVGAWDDPGGDDKGVLETFRSLAEGGSVAACCSALASNAVSAPMNQKPIYAAAVAVCQSLTSSKEGREALAQIRGKLPGVPIPAACN